jgi:peptidoglycan/xylan/chitin deacetylase (PgdA/CDA1 family)
VAEGHEVALHCNRHVRHDRLGAEEIRSDAGEGLRTLRKLGHKVRDWRAPWGVATRNTEDAAADLGLRLVGWTADSEDWRGDEADVMLGRLSSGIGDGAVVLMHDGVGPGALRDGCGPTVELVGPLLLLSASRGLAPVPVGRMLGSLPDRNPGTVAGV